MRWVNVWNADTKADSFYITRYKYSFKLGISKSYSAYWSIVEAPSNNNSLFSNNRHFGACDYIFQDCWSKLLFSRISIRFLDKTTARLITCYVALFDSTTLLSNNCKADTVFCWPHFSSISSSKKEQLKFDLNWPQWNSNTNSTTNTSHTSLFVFMQGP